MGVLEDLKSTLGLGARANKYKIILNGVGGGPEGAMVDTLAKSTAIPSRSFADIEIWYQGRLVTVAGEAQYSDAWSITFMDDEKHTLRGKFNDWMEFIDSVANNSRDANTHNSYMTIGKVQQLSTVDNSITAEYEFSNVYPKNMSDSALADDSADLIEFSVEFNYSYWTKTK